MTPERKAALRRYANDGFGSYNPLDILDLCEALDAAERDRDTLRAEVEALHGALAAMVEWFWGRTPESATEAADRVAVEFYAETGFIAPGKSVPLAMHPPWTEDERRAAWDAWVKAKRGALEARARAALDRTKGER
jgi:PAS domain-containing protein